jgi:hypothetical protein
MPLPSLVPLLIPALYVVLAVALKRKYLRTRDAGFIWLGVAVVLWPLASRLLDRVLLDRIVSGHSTGGMTLGEIATLAGSIQQLIAIGLSLVAVLYLSRTNIGRALQPAA